MEDDGGVPSGEVHDGIPDDFHVRGGIFLFIVQLTHHVKDDKGGVGVGDGLFKRGEGGGVEDVTT